MHCVETCITPRLAMRHSVRYGRFRKCGWLCSVLPVMAGSGSVAGYAALCPLWQGSVTGYAAFCLLWQVREAWQSYLPPLGCGRGWKRHRQGRAAQCYAPAGTRMGSAENLPMAHGLSAEVGVSLQKSPAQGARRERWRKMKVQVYGPMQRVLKKEQTGSKRRKWEDET